MVRRAKTPHSNTKDEKESNRGSFNDDYYCVFSFKKIPVNDAIKREYARQLRQWIKDTPDAFKLSEFYLGRGLSSNSFYRWIKNNEEMAEAYQYVKEILGNKRELGAALKNGPYDPSMIKPTMGHYCPIWREEQERAAALTKKEDSAAANAEVIAMVAREMLRPLKVKE